MPMGEIDHEKKLELKLYETLHVWRPVFVFSMCGKK